jgi:hypothetical protein
MKIIRVVGRPDFRQSVGWDFGIRIHEHLGLPAVGYSHDPGEIDLQLVHIAEGIVDIESGGPGTVHNRLGGGSSRNFGSPLVQITSKFHLSRSRRRILVSHRDDQVLDCGGGVDPGDSINRDRLPALNPKSVGGIDQQAILVDSKRSVPGVEAFLPVFQYEEPFTLDGQIRHHAGCLQRPLSMDRVDRGDDHPQADLLGIDPAHLIGGFGRAGEGLGEHVLEVYPPLLKAGRVDVGDVVSQNIHSYLVVLETGNSGIKRTHHGLLSLLFLDAQDL